MKITEFLKYHSLIDAKFIDDFYSFYDDGKNEYDYTINLETLAEWLEVKKGHLKDLLISNFEENDDYIELKNNNGIGLGTGKNNRKHVLLRYMCAKELCMISRSKKSNVIRKFYIELEKLLITYKDNIVNDLHNQLGIINTNNNIIEKNKNTGLIYVLKIDNNIVADTDKNFESKIGSTLDLEQRMRDYRVGRTKELPIVFIYRTEYVTDIETCIKQNLKMYQLKYNTETFYVDLGFIKETIKYCSLKNSKLLMHNKKLLNNTNDNQKFIVVINKYDTDKLNKLEKDINKITKIMTTKKIKTIHKNKSNKTSKIFKSSKMSKHSKGFHKSGKKNYKSSNKLSNKISNKKSNKISNKKSNKISNKSLKKTSNKSFKKSYKTIKH